MTIIPISRHSKAQIVKRGKWHYIEASGHYLAISIRSAFWTNDFKNAASFSTKSNALIAANAHGVQCE